MATSRSGYVLNANDKVIQEAGLTVSEALMQTSRQSDGALLAWKAIVVG